MKKERKDEFLNALAIESGIRDVDAVRSVYYSLLRLTVRNAKKFGVYRLPDFGDFRVKLRPPRRHYDISQKKSVIRPEVYTMQFRADYKISNNINNRLPHYLREKS